MTLGRAHARATVRAVAACARAGRAYPHESIPFYASLEPLFIGRVHISIGWLDRALQVDGASRIPGRNVDKSAPNVDKSAEVVHIRGAVRCGAEWIRPHVERAHHHMWWSLQLDGIPPVVWPAERSAQNGAAIAPAR
jgi:hypothetical protein